MPQAQDFLRDQCYAKIRHIRTSRLLSAWGTPIDIADRLSNGKKIRMLTVIDEYTRKCLSIRVDYQLNSDDVLDVISTLFLTEGVPEYIRSDNGGEFTAKMLQDWLKSLGIKTAYIEPGSPWENGFNERFNGSLRDECLNLEYFHTLQEARIIIGQWVNEYNHIRPHSSLGYRPPALLVRLGNQGGELPHYSAI